MSLQEIQSVNLEMMKDIHTFCVEKGINYSLAYGSMIGAIRHKGFIPWDDDIDIMMTRPDFERFSREYKNTKGYVLSSVYDEDTYINYTRVFDSHTWVTHCPKSAKYATGIWIDVFPIDCISEDAVVSRKQFQELRHFTIAVEKWRKNLTRLEKPGIMGKLKSCVRLAQLLLTNKGSFPYWHQRICDICKEYPFGSTGKCSSLVCVEANRNDKQEIFSVEDFKEYILMPFEDSQFYVASGYDHILTTIFGDYMQIPPKEKQISHIMQKWEFYKK